MSSLDLERLEVETLALLILTTAGGGIVRVLDDPIEILKRIEEDEVSIERPVDYEVHRLNSLPIRHPRDTLCIAFESLLQAVRR